MKTDKEPKAIYSHDVLEFVTVGIEYCAFLEKSVGRPREEFLGTMLKLLPLLYVKAQLLPKVDSTGEWLPQGKVTEDDYNYVRRIVYDLLGNADQYLDISYENEMETDETQWKSVSEHLADIYQPVRKTRRNRFGINVDFDTYDIDYSNFPIGHGEKSAILALWTGLDITKEELLAIRWHMTAWELPMQSYEALRSLNTARDLHPLCALVQLADNFAAALTEFGTTIHI